MNETNQTGVLQTVDTVQEFENLSGAVAGTDRGTTVERETELADNAGSGLGTAVDF